MEALELITLRMGEDAANKLQTEAKQGDRTMTDADYDAMIDELLALPVSDEELEADDQAFANWVQL